MCLSLKASSSVRSTIPHFPVSILFIVADQAYLLLALMNILDSKIVFVWSKIFSFIICF